MHKILSTFHKHIIIRLCRICKKLPQGEAVIWIQGDRIDWIQNIYWLKQIMGEGARPLVPPYLRPWIAPSNYRISFVIFRWTSRRTTFSKQDQSSLHKAVGANAAGSYEASQSNTLQGFLPCLSSFSFNEC
jgi:hypothetical protein